MQLLNEVTQKLPVRLNDQELIEQSHALAHTYQEITDEEAEQTTLKGQMKARLTELQARLARLASIVASRTDYRDVVVEVQLMDDGRVEEIRTDTGAVILNRPMREEEKQRPLQGFSLVDSKAATKISTTGQTVDIATGEIQEPPG